MSTVRRLYFYGLALISIEVVIWGVVGLLRTIVSGGLVGAGSLLASGLSLVLVGLPIFYIHWRTAQNDALRDPTERASRVRAVFLYSALLGTVIPIVFAVVAILDRGLVQIFGLADTSAWFGRNQTALDNIIAVLVNAVVLAYFWTVLRSDWQADIPENHLHETRRLYRYLWVLAGLTLTVTGVYNLLRYLLYTPGLSENGGQTLPILAGGLTLLIVGLPLWIYYWQVVQTSLKEPLGQRALEQHSLLRLVVLYLISFAGVIGVLTFAGSVFNSLLTWILGENRTFLDFLQENSTQIGALVPLAVMWSYYGRVLNQEVAAVADRPRQSALRRLYYYILALLGLAVTLAGLYNLIDFTSRLIFTGAVVGSYRSLLSGALSSLLVGLPLWLISWRRMQAEAAPKAAAPKQAAPKDDAGDHARRSVLRKSYLYLVLFALVIGVMGFGGRLIYLLLNAALTGTPESDLKQTATTLFLALLVDALFLLYHLRALRLDGRVAQQSLGDLHAAFPTLVLIEEEQEFSRSFGDGVVQALAQIAPRLPVKIQPVERGAPDDSLLGARALLIPNHVILNPPEALKLWLDEYHGRRILVPEPTEGWVWLGQQAEKTPTQLGRDAAQAIRQLAEGEAMHAALTTNPWAITGYILGGVFGLILLIGMFSLMMSALFR
jgi:hypothetical protein